MLTIARRAALVLVVSSFTFATDSGAGQASGDDRIAALEAKVRDLEAMVLRLAAERAPAATMEQAAASLQPLKVPEPLETVALPSAAGRSRALPQELLPNLGKIGASAAFLAGAHSGPFALRAGSFIGGAVELPLANVPGGRLHYEFSASLGRSRTSMTVTSAVAQVANLAVLANQRPGDAGNVEASLDGRAPAPYPVRYQVDTRLQLLEVMPFGLKYVVTSFDRVRLRPYVAAGVATFVAISNQRSASGRGTPFEGALIGGQIAAAGELVGRGVPSGQGGLDIGVQAGGGVEYRATSGLSFGVDVRIKQPAAGGAYLTTLTRTSFHF